MLVPYLHIAKTLEPLGLAMDLDRLKEIVDWMKATPLSELEVVDGSFSVHLVKAAGQESTVASPAPESSAVEVTAPSHGVVHLSPAPTDPPFVRAGDTVSVGQQLCIIEAMKVFNPVEAEQAGAVSEVLVEDGVEVAAGQPLFRME